MEISGPWALNPDGGLILVARARLVRTRDRAVLYSRKLEHRGGSVFIEWPDADRARERLREHLNIAYARLADQIVGDLFGAAPSEDPSPENLNPRFGNSEFGNPAAVVEAAPPAYPE